MLHSVNDKSTLCRAGFNRNISNPVDTTLLCASMVHLLRGIHFSQSFNFTRTLEEGSRAHMPTLQGKNLDISSILADIAYLY